MPPKRTLNATKFYDIPDSHDGCCLSWLRARALSLYSPMRIEKRTSDRTINTSLSLLLHLGHLERLDECFSIWELAIFEVC